MWALALSSLRFRASGFAVTFINVFLGATVLMAFASLLDSGLAAGVSRMIRTRWSQWPS